MGFLSEQAHVLRPPRQSAGARLAGEEWTEGGELAEERGECSEESGCARGGGSSARGGGARESFVHQLGCSLGPAAPQPLPDVGSWGGALSQ